ncbi:hypothetical protein [Nocardia sp. XZ_19_369]|uniref:hypothetical protein n=1 Tax=Nocardia sp. XZ_19_369 TaxID=2769487 RepID=UPI00188F306A|nr:hypothetical protein [Nocardia sp. XZ_19_369]
MTDTPTGSDAADHDSEAGPAAAQPIRTSEQPNTNKASGSGRWHASRPVWVVLTAVTIASLALAGTTIALVLTHDGPDSSDVGVPDPRDIPVLDAFGLKQRVLVLDAVRQYFESIGAQDPVAVNARSCARSRIDLNGDGITQANDALQQQFDAHGAPHLEYTMLMEFPTRDTAYLDAVAYYDRPVDALGGATNERLRIDLEWEDYEWNVCSIRKR